MAGLRLLAAAFAAAGLTAGPAWQVEPPLALPRTEVTATASGGEVLVAGGYLEDGSTSGRVDLYDPAARSWRRGPDLPQPVNHAASATLLGRAVVVGGFGASGATTGASELVGERWRALPPLPSPRGAAGAAALRGRLYVVGGRVSPGRLARSMLAFDPSARRWSRLPGPTPREHLAVAASRGRVWAIGGRSAGYDTNTAIVESWAPGERRWRREPSLPEARGGTGAAAVGGRIVSVGGEAPSGTLGRVFALDVARRRWVELPPLPSPRHGLGVVAVDGRVYAVGGGPQPGLTVSGANESLAAG